MRNQTSFEHQRDSSAINEIITEVLTEKYEIPALESAVLLLHAGIVMLQVNDESEGPREFPAQPRT